MSLIFNLYLYVYEKHKLKEINLLNKFQYLVILDVNLQLKSTLIKKKGWNQTKPTTKDV